MTTEGTSTSQQIAATGPESVHVVKALNSIFGHVLAHDKPLDAFLAGDSAEAKTRVTTFLKSHLTAVPSRIFSRKPLKGPDLLVDLSGQLSNPQRPLERLISGRPPLVQPTIGPSGHRKPKQRQTRLTDAQRREIADRYRAGELRNELAALYGVSTGTVSAVLVAHGAVRSRGLTDAQVDRAVASYLAGDSLATVGQTLGVAADTVWARLIERGVRMRRASGTH